MANIDFVEIIFFLIMVFNICSIIMELLILKKLSIYRKNYG